MTDDEAAGLGRVARPARDGLSAGEHVYRVLRRELIDGTIPPGQRVMEIETAERLGVSRTPVREALRRLESDGFVQRLGPSRIVATPAGPDDLGDIGLLRVELDGLAARLAVARGSRRDWDQIASLVERIGSQTSVEALNAAHLEVHRALFAVGFGPRMHLFVENHVLPYLELAVSAGDGGPAAGAASSSPSSSASASASAVQRSHERLLRALSSGDVEKAVAAAREHAQAGSASAAAAHPRG